MPQEVPPAVRLALGRACDGGASPAPWAEFSSAIETGCCMRVASGSSPPSLEAPGSVSCEEGSFSCLAGYGGATRAPWLPLLLHPVLPPPLTPRQPVLNLVLLAEPQCLCEGPRDPRWQGHEGVAEPVPGAGMGDPSMSSQSHTAAWASAAPHAVIKGPGLPLWGSDPQSHHPCAQLADRRPGRRPSGTGLPPHPGGTSDQPSLGVPNGCWQGCCCPWTVDMA